MYEFRFYPYASAFDLAQTVMLWERGPSMTYQLLTIDLEKIRRRRTLSIQRLCVSGTAVLTTPTASSTSTGR